MTALIRPGFLPLSLSLCLASAPLSARAQTQPAELAGAQTSAETAPCQPLPVLPLIEPVLPSLSQTAPASHLIRTGQRHSHKVVVSTEPRRKGHHWLKARILIQAPPQLVWDTVHTERQHDPDLAYSKLLEKSGNYSLLEQKFCLIPVIGTAVCQMENLEVPGSRIDFWLKHSDRFKALEGSWILTPGADGQSRYLELSSFIDMGLPLPRPLIEGVQSKKLERRLANIKNMAERQCRRTKTSP